MKSSAAAQVPEINFRRRTMDGHMVEIDAAGDVWCHLFTVTRHRLPRLEVQKVLAEAVGTFDRAELPALVKAAAELSRGGRVPAFCDLVQRAIVLSAKGHTIPADMPPAVVTVTLSAPHEPWERNLPPGTIPVVRPGRRCKVELPR